MAIDLNLAAVSVVNEDGQFEKVAALNGSSLYDVAVKAGFKGTEEEWIALIMDDSTKIETIRELEKQVNNILLDGTKDLMGLSRNATPDDAFRELFDISSAHLSNRAPTENDAAAPGKVWMVPYMRFNNLMPNAIELTADNWVSSGATRHLSADSITLTGVGNKSTIEVVANILANNAKGHKVFISAKVTALTAANNITLELVGSGGSTIKAFSANVPDAGNEYVWNALVDSADNLGQLVFSSAYNSAATQSGQEIKIERIFIFDLTSDMCGMPYELDEFLDYLSIRPIFQYEYHPLSETYWVCHGESYGKTIWVSQLMESNSLNSYNAFVENIRVETLNMALGKGNNYIRGIGKALAMYAKYKNTNVDIAKDFPKLIQCDTVLDIITSDAIYEAVGNDDILTLLKTATFPRELSDTIPSEFWDKMLTIVGLPSDILDTITSDDPYWSNDVQFWAMIHANDNRPDKTTFDTILEDSKLTADLGLKCFNKFTSTANPHEDMALLTIATCQRTYNNDKQTSTWYDSTGATIYTITNNGSGARTLTRSIAKNLPVKINNNYSFTTKFDGYVFAF